ncbi:family 16 glycoside hydrolase [Bifidobacterium sp. ESL0704]|uniref:family 16 glycoside hydrolase n=1 Tax=Bifidobacterium sp. ESL0704 TaxID=2983219 RepID=UPI0023FA428D|nr:family 16 glycoside hydrolase [Bifidobacterium sp. ESL0704]WEV52753.1 DUF1080 domain-containing protein [Bifidobacterium sp. ESL0704]
MRTQRSGKTQGVHYRAAIRKTMTVAVAMMVAVPMALCATPAMAAQGLSEGAANAVKEQSGSNPVEVTVDGGDVARAALNKNGLTFKGFGELSANSTSSLLMDYKAEHPQQYWKMIDVLFGGKHPLMNTVKIEMGNDRNTSTGPNAAVMRGPDEYPDVAREPGFQLASDALKVNPGLKVSILRWKYPQWVGSDNNHDNIYKWYKNTILAVYREYGYMVDSVNPHINEQKPDYAWTKDFANRVKTDESGFEGAGSIKDFDGRDVPAWKDAQEKAAFHKIRTLISDEVGTGSFGADMFKDPDLMKAVDIAGFHYNTADDKNGDFKKLADQQDKEIWNSEAQATFSFTADRPNNTMNTASGEGSGTNNGKNDGKSGVGIGGINSALEMANTAIKGFTSSRRTNFVYQPAIGSFYDGFQYSSKELLSARDPWSGWMHYDGGLATLEQFSRFAKTGYENATNTAGIWRGIPEASRSDMTDGNPPGRGTGASSSRGGATSYMTLAAPDKSAFSTVIVNDSAQTKTYRISAKNMSLKAGASAPMQLWETTAADAGQPYNGNYVRPIAQINPDGQGAYEFSVKPFSMLTATTLDYAQSGPNGTLKPRDGEGSMLPASKEYVNGKDQAVLDQSSDNIGPLYADDFEYRDKKVETYKQGATVEEDYLHSRGGDTGATPRYTDDTNGAFEVVKLPDGSHVLRQQVGEGMNAGAWNGGDPMTTVGDNRWANYEASVRVYFENGADNGKNAYATIGAREQGGNANGIGASAAQLRVTPSGDWALQRFGVNVASGKLGDTAGVNWKAGLGQWNTIAIRVAGDTYTALVNGVTVGDYRDAAAQASGRVQIGTSFTNVRFDDLKVDRVAGYTPYYTDFIDNMHQRSWGDTSTPILQYNKDWQHLDGQGMFVYKRSISTSTAKGATLTYRFSGTGLDIIGANSGKARLNVSVDGKRILSNASTLQASNLATTFMLRGLGKGQHVVVIETANAEPFSVDAVGVVSDAGKAAVESSKVDTGSLRAALEKVKDYNAGEYYPSTWDVFDAARAAAKSALDDPAGYGLDAEGASALIARLDAASKNLVGKDVSPDIDDLGAMPAVSADSGLPASITIDGQRAKVSWSDESAQAVAKADAYSWMTVSGVSAALKDGLKHRFTANVEILPTLDMAYFIDSGAGATSAEYESVKAGVPGLLNQVADQKAGASTDASTAWGYGDNAVVKSATEKDKYQSGLYQNGQELDYTLPLKAGSYRITAGFTEWWSGENRPMKLEASWNEGGVAKSASGSHMPSLTTAGRNGTGTVDFSLGADATVTFKVLSDGGKDPVISWLGVEHEPMPLGVIAAVAGSSLPSSVAVNGKQTDVQWSDESLKAFSQANEYDTIDVRGSVADKGGSNGRKAVSARIEVVPAGLRYYIDSGTSGVASPQYLAVKAERDSIGNPLKNDAVDRVAPSASEWGYEAAGVKVKGGTDINDKYSTGLYQDTTKQVYHLPLDAGNYTLTAGFAEWWGQDRTMYQTASVGGTQIGEKATVALSGTNTPLHQTLRFKLDAPATVDYVVTNEGAGGNKPVISWLAVAADLPAKVKVDKLQDAVSKAKKLNEADYTKESWEPFANALKSAESVLDRAQSQNAIADAQDLTEPVTQQDVDAAVEKLNKAESALVRISPPAPSPSPTPNPSPNPNPTPTPNPGGSNGNANPGANGGASGSPAASNGRKPGKAANKPTKSLVSTGVDVWCLALAAIVAVAMGCMLKWFGTFGESRRSSR